MATPFFGVILGPYTTNESHVRRCLPLQMAQQPWRALVKYSNIHSLHKRNEISWPPEWLSACTEGFYSVRYS